MISSSFDGRFAIVVSCVRSMSLPSTTPDLKVYLSALSFMNFEIAFDKMTGSFSVHAIAVTPLNASAACSNCVSFVAILASVFFTT